MAERRKFDGNEDLSYVKLTSACRRSQEYRVIWLPNPRVSIEPVHVTRGMSMLFWRIVADSHGSHGVGIFGYRCIPRIQFLDTSLAPISA